MRLILISKNKDETYKVLDFPLKKFVSDKKNIKCILGEGEVNTATLPKNSVDEDKILIKGEIDLNV